MCCRRPAPMRLVPFSYFWTCWNVSPSASATSGLAHVKHQSPHSHAAADMLVRWIKSSPGHLCFLAVAAIFSGYPGPVPQVPGAV
jgi:hypothetical protein